MSDFKVLLIDGIDDAGVDLMKKTHAVEPVVHHKLPREELLETMSDMDGIVVRSATKVDRELISSAPKLKVIGRAGVGVDNVDIGAATERGVIVMNSPGGSTMTTAEHTIAMMFALSRNIPQAYRLLKDHTWDKSRFRGVELTGKTLGVVGLGRIGSHVAHIAQGIGMNVIAYDPFISPAAELSSGLRLVELGQIYAESDFISLHAPLTERTRHFINAGTIAEMKDRVRIVNCARGGIVSEGDLYDALKSGKVAGAAFDVFEQEPNTNSPLLELDNFIATPHLGASTVEAQRKVSEDICGQILDFLVRNAVRGALNFPQLEAGQLERYQHFVDLSSRLASFAGQISDGRIESVSIRYSGEVCDMNLGYLTSTILKQVLKPILGERVNLINAGHVAGERGIKIEEIRAPVPENFTNLVGIEIGTDRGAHRVSGTVFTDKQARIVSLEGYAIEVVPSGYMIFITNHDAPGVIGRIGTLLGECSVNVAGMYVGRDQEGGKALALLRIDEPVSGDVLDQIRNIENILSAKAVFV
jgi:D-3-phosphoglycerate dehydrogenase